MSEVTRETIVTKEHNAVPVSQTSVKSSVASQVSQTQYIEQIIYFFLGVLEVLLGFRFILKMMGANQSGGFVQFIYRFSNIFVYPFEGIFRRAVTQGIETSSVIEPATIVAFIVYGILAWGIVTLIRVLMGETQ